MFSDEQKGNYINFLQAGLFSDFSLISDFFTLTPLKIIFEMSPLEHVSHDFMVDFHSDFQKRPETFSLNQTYIPVQDL